MSLDLIQQSFSGGEWSPLLDGRSDLEKYYSACQLLENMIPTRYGPAERRPGLYYGAEVKDSSKKTRVLPFKYSTVQAYPLEFGDQYIRFYKDRGQIKYTDISFGANPSGDFAADATMTGASSGATAIVVAKVSTQVYTIKYKQGTWTDGEIINCGDKNVDCAAGYPTTATSSTAVEITSPYLEADLFGLQRIQSADVMYLFHPSYNPRKLMRYSHDHWELESIDFDWPPFMDENKTDTTITPPSPPTDVTGSETYDASSEHASHPPDDAFNDDSTSDIEGWLSVQDSITNQWIKVDFGDGDTKTIVRMKIQPLELLATPTRCPRHIKLQGSNNDADWTKIPASEWTAFCSVYNTDEIECEQIDNFTDWIDIQFTNAVAYRYYRIYVYDNWGHPEYVGIKEIEMFEAAGNVYIASSPIFTSDHVGSFWLIKHPRTADEPISPNSVTSSESDDLFNAAGEVTTILKDVEGSWNFRTAGTWAGVVVLERSYDEGISWHTLETLKSSSDQNFNIPGNEVLGDAWLRARWVSGAGPCEPTLSVDRYYHYGIIKVTEVTDSTHIKAAEIREVHPASATRITYAFVDSDPDTITDSSNNFLNDGFAANQTIIVSGSTDNDGTYTIASVVAGTITLIAADTLTAEGAGDTVTIKIPTKLWSEGAWSDERGYPSCATFHEERLMCGGTTYEPHGLKGSMTFDWENFRTGALDDHSIAYTLAANEMNAIRWLMSKDVLLMGTAGAEWKLGAFDRDEPLTPSNPVEPRIQTTYGSKNIQAIMLANIVLFVVGGQSEDAPGRVVRGAQYVFEKGEAGGYDAPDYTTLSEHITESGIVSMAYQQQPEPVLWCGLDNGYLIGMTFEPGQKVWGWFRVVTKGLFESKTVIPGVGEDEVWCIVNREIDGSTKRYVEYFKPRDWGDDQKDCFFVDSGLTFDGGDAITITGITKANPCVVTAVAHGRSDGDQVRIRYVGGMTEVNAKVFTVSNPDTDTFELRDKLDTVDIDSTGYTAFVASITGDITYDSTGIKNVNTADIAAIAVGAPITAVGVPTGATITAINDDWFTISEKATVTDTGITITIVGIIEKVDNTFSGLDHLEGKTVSVLGDGTVHDDVVVSSGVITLTDYFNKVHAGLPYNSDLMPMKLNFPTQVGTAGAKVKRTHQAVFSFHKSLGCEFGSLNDDGIPDLTETIPFRKTTDTMGEAVPLFTGEKTATFPGRYGLEGNIYVRQSQPLPLTVRSITQRLKIYG